MAAADGPALSYTSAPGRWVLAITVLGSGIAALDATVVNIALPAIGREFHTGIAALQWVMTSYILTLAAFLLIGGSLGDRFVLGLGLAITVAPLTATAMSSAPAQHAGIASAINNDLARFGGLLAVAVLPALAGITGPAYLRPDALAAGFRTAVLISGGLCAAGGLLAAVTITNPRKVPRSAGGPAPEECLHCGLDAPPLTTSVGRLTGCQHAAG